MEFEIGGVTIKDVIKFQTRIMFGAQYGRIEYAKKNNDQAALILACLRIGWNDAFRHVTNNKESVDKNIKDYLRCDNELKDEFCLKYGKVSYKTGRKKYDDYYSSILEGNKEDNKNIMSIFKEYASAKTTDDKCQIIQNNLSEINESFAIVKEKVLFGHIQKLFNIAIKLYLCLYMCKDYLDLNELLFYKEIVSALKYADCPIDSIILDQFEQKEMKRIGKGQKHKLLYPEIKWSEISSVDEINTYSELQDQFRREYIGKSSLYFDFAEWN